MSKVEDRVALWLSSHPGSTLVEVARGVHAKDETVRDVLGGPLFRFSISGKAYRYWLRGDRGTSRDEVRRPSPETDCDFLHRVLSDGEWHTLEEILRRSRLERGHGLTVHTRASDLRTKRGLAVEWEKIPGAGRGEDSRYRLLLDVEGRVGEAAVDPGSFPVRRSTVPTTGPSTSSSPGDVDGVGTSGGAVCDPDADMGAQPFPSPNSVSSPGDSAGEQDPGAALSDSAGQMTLTGGAFTKQRRAA